MKKQEIIKRLKQELDDEEEYLITFEYGFQLNKITIDNCNNNPWSE